MTLHFASPHQARQWCRQQRGAGNTIGFVPTMGALHEGHLSLVRRAVAENDVCCASIFVNPLQFNDDDDYAGYPVNREHDLALLREARCAMVFSGALEDFFPEAGGRDRITLQPAGPRGEGLEGAFRPGYLDGVCTIVERLFATVAPERAYFGRKDFQQSLVVTDLARRLGHPEIVVCPTQREPDGLARSSRNVLLAPDERARATCIHRALQRARAAWQDGEHGAAHLHQIMRDALDTGGVVIEYAEVRDPLRWSGATPSGDMERAQALIAVRIGKVRLIDTMRLDGEGGG